MKKYQEVDMSFGERLRLFRKYLGINSNKFSILCGISYGTLNAVENDKTKTSLKLVRNLIQNTDINIYWLFFW